MSLGTMAEVWATYPGAGDELLLALAFADAADRRDMFEMGDPRYWMRKCRLTPERWESLIAEMLDRGTLVHEQADTYRLHFRF